MNKKLILLMCLLMVMMLSMSGCFVKEMVTSDDEKISGDWYDSKTKAYFVFHEDGSYQSGNGLYADHAGGYYKLVDDTILLTISYTIMDGQKEVVNEPDQNVVEMKYRFDLDGNLIIRSSGSTISLSRIDPEPKAEEQDSEMLIQGLYKSTQDELHLYFDGNGGVSRSTGSGDKTYSGSYTVSDQELTLTFEGESKTYYFSFNDQNQLILSSEGGQQMIFDKVN